MKDLAHGGTLSIIRLVFKLSEKGELNQFITCLGSLLQPSLEVKAHVNSVAATLTRVELKQVGLVATDGCLNQLEKEKMRQR